LKEKANAFIVLLAMQHHKTHSTGRHECRYVPLVEFINHLKVHLRVGKDLFIDNIESCMRNKLVQVPCIRFSLFLWITWRELHFEDWLIIVTNNNKVILTSLRHHISAIHFRTTLNTASTIGPLLHLGRETEARKAFADRKIGPCRSPRSSRNE
ncbi:hypothetical protein Tcan_01808, partial [Toxocara canis]